MDTAEIYDVAVKLAEEAGVSHSKFWTEQVLLYLEGNRGQDMHDATLVYMSREYPNI